MVMTVFIAILVMLLALAGFQAVFGLRGIWLGSPTSILVGWLESWQSDDWLTEGTIQVMTLILGMTASVIPIFCAFTMALLAIAAVLPMPLKHFAQNVVFLLTTDKAPVLSQVGSALGVAAALLTSIATLIK
jgi:hypothetical protein